MLKNCTWLCPGLLQFLADPDKARGYSTNTPVIHSFIHSLTLSLTMMKKSGVRVMMILMMTIDFDEQ